MNGVMTKVLYCSSFWFITPCIQWLTLDFYKLFGKLICLLFSNQISIPFDYTYRKVLSSNFYTYVKMRFFKTEMAECMIFKENSFSLNIMHSA